MIGNTVSRISGKLIALLVALMMLVSVLPAGFVSVAAAYDYSGWQTGQADASHTDGATEANVSFNEKDAFHIIKRNAYYTFDTPITTTQKLTFDFDAYLEAAGKNFRVYLENDTNATPENYDSTAVFAQVLNNATAGKVACGKNNLFDIAADGWYHFQVVVDYSKTYTDGTAANDFITVTASDASGSLGTGTMTVESVPKLGTIRIVSIDDTNGMYFANTEFKTETVAAPQAPPSAKTDTWNAGKGGTITNEATYQGKSDVLGITNLNAYYPLSTPVSSGVANIDFDIYLTSKNFRLYLESGNLDSKVADDPTMFAQVLTNNKDTGVKFGPNAGDNSSNSLFAVAEGGGWYHFNVAVNFDKGASDAEFITVIASDASGTEVGRASMPAISGRTADKLTQIRIIKTSNAPYVANFKVSTGEVKLTANLVQLNKAINDAESKVQADYTSDSWTAMQTALTAAKTTQTKYTDVEFEDEAALSAAQSEVNAVTQDLKSAIENLINLVIDKTALAEAITRAEGIVADKDSYTADSWAASSVETVLAAAKTVNGNAEATQQQVDAQVKAINDAIAVLKIKVSYRGTLVEEDAVLSDYQAAWKAGADGSNKPPTWAVEEKTVGDYTGPMAWVSAINIQRHLKNSYNSGVVTYVQDIAVAGNNKWRIYFEDSTYNATNNNGTVLQILANGGKLYASSGIGDNATGQTELISTTPNTFYRVVTEFDFASSSAKWIKVSVYDMSGNLLGSVDMAPQTTAAKSLAGVRVIRATGSQIYVKGTQVYHLNTTVDKNNLTIEINNTSGIAQESDYTVASWNAYKTALNNAQSILKNDNVTQAQVDEAIANLVAAKANLQYAGLFTGDLDATLAKVSGLAESNYTEASWANLVAAKSAAEDILRKAQSSNTTNEAIQDANLALIKAMKEIIPLNGEVKGNVIGSYNDYASDLSQWTFTKASTGETEIKDLGGNNGSAIIVQESSAEAKMNFAPQDEGVVTVAFDYLNSGTSSRIRYYAGGSVFLHMYVSSGGFFNVTTSPTSTTSKFLDDGATTSIGTDENSVKTNTWYRIVASFDYEKKLNNVTKWITVSVYEYTDYEKKLMTELGSRNVPPISQDMAAVEGVAVAYVGGSAKYMDNVTVAVAATTSADSVRELAKAALDNAGLYKKGNITVNSGDSVTSSFYGNFKTSFSGIEIPVKWTSSDDSVISISESENKFKVTRSSANKMVTLTASITATIADEKTGEEKEETFTKEYKIYVTGTATTTGGGGGGNGGNGGSGIVNRGGFGGTSYVTPVANLPVEQKDAENVGLVFPDMKSAAWANEAVKYLVENGIVTGTSENTFDPNSNITREQFVAILVRLYNVDTTYTQTDIGLSDIDYNQWYAPYLVAAYQFNIIRGFDDGTFGVGQQITREDMAVMTLRMVDFYDTVLPKRQSDTVFADEESISDYALRDVHRLQRASIINGFEDGTFGPKQSATRAEAAKIVYELCMAKNLNLTAADVQADDEGADKGDDTVQIPIPADPTILYNSFTELDNFASTGVVQDHGAKVNSNGTSKLSIIANEDSGSAKFEIGAPENGSAEIGFMVNAKTLFDGNISFVNSDGELYQILFDHNGKIQIVSGKDDKDELYYNDFADYTENLWIKFVLTFDLKPDEATNQIAVTVDAYTSDVYGGDKTNWKPLGSQSVNVDGEITADKTDYNFAIDSLTFNVNTSSSSSTLYVDDIYAIVQSE